MSCTHTALFQALKHYFNVHDMIYKQRYEIKFTEILNTEFLTIGPITFRFKFARKQLNTCFITFSVLVFDLTVNLKNNNMDMPEF